ncbi:MAG: AgmX/PglI C-terminal domain-containing protein [Myxococcales bacterium]|nr:AgmX/PglI C-terminal domain-containing protein [Myxococcales bacterium]MCB9521930.1 AgmX/PglI C-terminal domain-containing protein [Myxococcales bacterium]
MRRIALGVLVGLLPLVGCKETPPPAAPPPVDQGVDAAPADAALPEITIQMGNAAFEFEAVDAGPDAAPAAAARPAPKPARPVYRAPPPKPKPTARPAAVSAMATIQAHQGDVANCYSAVALKDPTVRGQIVVQWTLARDGRPSATAILKDTLKDKSVGACIKQKARGWRFPPPKGGVGVISYPFNLSVQ